MPNPPPHPAFAIGAEQAQALLAEGFTACMREASKQAWMHKLRTTKAPQTQHTLVRRCGEVSGYCCLGVAATLLDKYEEGPSPGPSMRGRWSATQHGEPLGNALAVDARDPMALYHLTKNGAVPWADLTDQERTIVEALGYKEPDMSFLKAIESGGWTEFPDDKYNGSNDIPSAVTTRIQVLRRDGSSDYTYPRGRARAIQGETPWDRIRWQRCDAEPEDDDTVAWRHA